MQFLCGCVIFIKIIYMSTADEIKKLKELLDSEVITKEEFEMQKAKLLNDKNNKIPKFTINKAIFNLDNKNFKLIIICLFVILCFFAFDSVSNTTTSSDIINSIQDQELAGGFSFNTFSSEPAYKNSDGLYGSRYFYTEKIEFDIYDHPRGKGGQVFFCKSRNECNLIFEYFDNYRGLVGPFVFQSSDGKMVMQLNSETPIDIAKKFEEIVDDSRNIKARSHDCTGRYCFLGEY